MAGNIQWFRWHHGSVTDPKFKLIAHKAKQSLATVIAVWAFVLEQASASDDRGTFGDIDCESLDCLLGLEDGATAAIMHAMEGRGLIDNSSVSAWEKRQPRREREDDKSTERSKAFRQKQRHATPEKEDATPCNAMQRQETPRVEKSREEIEERAKALVGSADRQPGQSPMDDGQPSVPTAMVPSAPEVPEVPTCPPLADLVALYHEALPSLPRVRILDDPKRRRTASAFWRWVLTSKKSNGYRRATGRAEAMSWIREFFERADLNDFLMGRGFRSGEHQNWVCDFDFLMSEKGRKHVIEKTREAA